MSLRTRLTLVFTGLMGGVLILASVVVFSIVSSFMIQNVDRDLRDAALGIILELQTQSTENTQVQELQLEYPLQQYAFQVWSKDGVLLISNPDSLTTALNEKGLTTPGQEVETVVALNTQMRVYSQPIYNNQKNFGVLEIGINLRQVTKTQNTLAIVLLVTTVVGTVLTGIFIWMASDKVLQPLEDVVNTASQISRVDDLSRRIPVKSKRKDEVGVLIQVMNQTFERLENLLLSQQRFLADVSHDLRTPLTVIKSNAELMRKTGRAEAESLDSIDQEVNHLTHMVGDLLLLVQAESGQLQLEWEPVRLDKLVEDVVTRMRPLTEGKLSLTWADAGETWVRGDAFRLKLVFDNLVSNAIKFTPKDGYVIVVMTKTAKDVRVSVSDTGPGISARDLPHVFERFFRAEPSRPRGEEGGFGLGLSISNWIVKQHHGEISVKSKVGEGTTFTVRLPRYTKEE